MLGRRLGGLGMRGGGRGGGKRVRMSLHDCGILEVYQRLSR